MSRLLTVAQAIKAKGLKIIRGGAYKPRTSPYDFQGLGFEGLKILKRVSDETGFAVITEIVTPVTFRRSTRLYRCDPDRCT